MNTPDSQRLALQWLYHWEKVEPLRIALTQPLGQRRTRSFDWAEVADGARRMAAHLKSQGWEPGSKVAILSKNCAWWLMSDLAIWMAGYVSVPLYPTLASDTVGQILTHSEARACFIGKLDDWPQMRAGVPQGLPCISYPLSPPDVLASCDGWEDLCAHTPPLAGEPSRRADELATLIYTSGTTGRPKGVMHTFGNFAWAVDKGLQRITMSSADRMLSYLPLAHVVERVLVEHGWLWTGAQLFFCESLETFTLDLQRARPTVFFSVPRLWVKFQHAIHRKLPAARLDLALSIPIVGRMLRRRLLQALGLERCRIAAGGAAPMPVELLGWFRRLGLPINEGYGMTENLALSHLTLPGHNQEGTVGPAYDGVEVRIDPQTGEIQMRSGALMTGYFKEPELTAQAIGADGWLHTGDKGTIDPRGLLHITGRLKDVFKTSKGKYVAPAPIEDRLVMHDAVEACVVCGANLGQPLGIVMLTSEATAELVGAGSRQRLETSLTQHLKQVNATLDPHERLKCLVLATTPWSVDNNLLTPTFKVKRNRIEEVYGAGFAHWEACGRPVVWETD